MPRPQMAVPRMCWPAVLLRHQNHHNTAIRATPSWHHWLPTIAYRSTGIHLLPSNGLTRSTSGNLPHLLPDPPVLDSGPRTRVLSTDDRHPNRKQRSDSATDALSVRFAHCSTERIFRVPVAIVLPGILLDLGSLPDVHGCS